MNWEAEEAKVSVIEARIHYLAQTIEAEQLGFRKAKRTLTRTQQAQEILQFVAQGIQQQAHEKISVVVSSCLSAVFEDPYEFKILFERKRGRTEATLLFTRRGMDVDPLSATGGGVVDVAAFALRIACLMLHRPRLSKVVVLDEPFKFVSAEYREAVRAMLENLSKDLGIQIIMVTHSEEYEIGRIIKL